MKYIATLPLILSLSGIALAQSDNMDMKNMTGMDMNQKSQAASSNEAVGVVKQIDRDKGMATLAHGPVKSLGWPAMTMSFTVENKALFDKLAPGRKVRFEFVKQGGKYVITGVE